MNRKLKFIAKNAFQLSTLFSMFYSLHDMFDLSACHASEAYFEKEYLLIIFLSKYVVEKFKDINILNILEN